MTRESATVQQGYLVSPANLGWPWVSVHIVRLDGTTREALLELLYRELLLRPYETVILEQAGEPIIVPCGRLN